MNHKPLGWLGILRLALVQTSLGAIVVLATSTLNRVMVVEYGLVAAIPAGLVAWHHAVQVTRPHWGYAADVGGKRTPWIIGGMGILALGALLATDSAVIMAASPFVGAIMGFAGFSMIGAGVGAAGTSLLALLASRVAPVRRPAAAAITWIMMIAGFVLTAAVAGAMLDPFSPERLMAVVTGVVLTAFVVSCLAVLGIEGAPAATAVRAARPAFGAMVREVWDDPRARGFAIFVLVSMLAYAMQDLIFEPFAGLIFQMTPGQSTQLAGMQQAGVLLGMVLVAAVGARFGGHKAAWMRGWTAGGCLLSGVALAGLALASFVGPGWPLAFNGFLLGFGNGVFAVAAIGSMMGLAGAGGAGREGTRMGVWGAAQAVGFGFGGLLGAGATDVLRAATANDALAFSLVFAAEGLLFVFAAALAWRLARNPVGEQRLPILPSEPVEEPVHSY